MRETSASDKNHVLAHAFTGKKTAVRSKWQLILNAFKFLKKVAKCFAMMRRLFLAVKCLALRQPTNLIKSIGRFCEHATNPNQ